ncbi:acetyltransferase [Paenibacillus sp. J31TS4]|nr:acetyltransferase [Paenibacillus sp. J31TS4]
MVDIWFEGSKQAHSFIPEEYWASNREAMKTVYLPMAQSFVLEENGMAAGFASIIDDYLAALFIRPAEQGKGYGGLLLNYVKERTGRLRLKVYQQNENAVRFYQRNGFRLASETIDELTFAPEYELIWQEEQ